MCKIENYSSLWLGFHQKGRYKKIRNKKKKWKMKINMEYVATFLLNADLVF